MKVIVFANEEYQPPWGSWHKLSNDVSRRQFTIFRKAINDIIAPIFIDHVEFVHICKA